MNTDNPPAPRTRSPLILAKGFCMGSADIVPGVSGGTMALILGIYERLLDAIRSFDVRWLQDLFRFRFRSALARNDLGFLAPLGLGIVLALLFFTRVVPLPQLIVSYPEQVYALFFGLILASIFVLMREVERFGPSQLLLVITGTTAGWLIVTLVPLQTPDAYWFIFLCGFVAICAMLLPGISGSFILLILGKYAYIIDALGRFDLAVIAIFAAGAACGLLAFSRFIGWLLDHYHQATLLLIKGILIGSLWLIWPFQERVYETIRGKQKLVGSKPAWPAELDAGFFLSVGLLVAGLVAVLLIHRLAMRERNAQA